MSTHDGRSNVAPALEVTAPIEPQYPIFGLRVLAMRILIFLGTLLLLVNQARAQIVPLTHGAVTLHTSTGDHRFQVEVAEQVEQRMLGLMFRRTLAPDAGMLFRYNLPQRIEIWMQNTYIPLDIVFVDGSGRVVGLVERAVPLSREIHQSPLPASAALELNGGTASRIGLQLGDQLTFEP